jgi:hypothetical protein
LRIKLDKKFWVSLGLVMLIGLTFSVACFAGNTLDVNGGTAGLEQVVTNGANTFASSVRLVFGTLVAAFFIWGGVLFLTASGNSPKISEAKSKFTYALGSLVIVLLADKIVGFVMAVIPH